MDIQILLKVLDKITFDNDMTIYLLFDNLWLTTSELFGYCKGNSDSVIYEIFIYNCIQQPAIITVIALICLQHIWVSTQAFQFMSFLRIVE